MTELDEKDALDISHRIGLEIAEYGPQTIGMILSDLNAMWVAGHYAASGKKSETDQVREQVIAAMLKAMRSLVEIIDEEMEEKRPKDLQ